MTRIIIFTLVLFLSGPFAFAEVVVLKSGEAFEGTIIERTENYIQIQTGGAPVYLAMDQISEITDKLPDPTALTRTATQPNQVNNYPSLEHSYTQQPVPEMPLIDGKDGKYYYELAKRDFQSGNLKESMKNLYHSASLGVEDSENLKGQLTKAASVAETVDVTKEQLKKAVGQLDPAIQIMIFKVALIIGVGFIIFLIVKFFTRERQISDVSPIFKMQRAVLAGGGGKLEGFVKAGPNKRVCAYLIDCCIAAVPCLAVQFLAGSMFSALLWLGYLLVKDCFMGQSLGKKLVGIQVVDIDNNPAWPNQALMRNMFWIIVCVLPLFNPVLWLLSVAIVIYEYVALIRDPLGQRFGDKLALTRVYDLKPHQADWKFIIFSLLTVIVWFLIYSASAYVLAKALNRTDLLVIQKEFHDPLKRFSMSIPEDFNQNNEVAGENVYVFDRPGKGQRLSVIVVDKEDDDLYAKEQFEQVAVSFLAMKLKTTPQVILENTNRAPAMVSGRHGTMFVYETDQGKNVSICLLQGKKFFEVHFLFKQGEVDQAMVLRFLMNFKALT